MINNSVLFSLLGRRDYFTGVIVEVYSDEDGYWGLFGLVEEFLEEEDDEEDEIAVIELNKLLFPRS